MPKTTIKIEDLYRIKYLREITLSPDGRYVAYTVEWLDRDDNKYYLNLFVVDFKGNNRCFIRGKKNIHQPRWSPDGRLISFLQTVKEKTNIWAIPANGGEAYQITDTDGSFGIYAWIPGTQYLVAEFTEKKIDPDRQPNQDKPPLYYQITRPRYKLDNTGMLTNEKPHIWSINTRNGRMKQITFGPNGDRDPAVSPNGQWLVYVSNRQNDEDDRPLDHDLFISKINGREEHRLPTPAGPKGRPCFSPDSQSVAYIGREDPEDFSIRYDDIWLVPTRGGRARNLTAPYELCIGDAVIDDLGFHGTAQIKFDRQGTKIYFPVTEKGACVLYQVETSTTAVSRVTGSQERIYAFDYDGQNCFALAVSTPTDPGNLFLLSQTRRVQLTDLNRNFIRQRLIGKPREIWFKGDQNELIQGWLIKPTTRSTGQQYPLAVQIHGGPHTAYGYSFFHEFQVLAGNGFAVFYCNPHGSMGISERFARSLHRRWGIPDSVDILKGIKTLTRLNPDLDSQRLAVMGGSYGGFMTNWLIGHTNIFKAAITMRSVVNMLSFITTDFGYTLGREFWGHWWEKNNFRRYWRMSPLRYARNMKTPLLILHSEQDHRCPISQAEELYITLKTLKREVEMVRFPQESHELSRHGTPRRREKRLFFIVDFLNRRLKKTSKNQ